MTAVLIVDATRGFDALLNNDLHAAHAILTATDSAFHALGLGLVKFLEAALGQEDNDLVGALQALLKAETAATAQLVPRASDPPTPFEPGTEFKLLVALAVMLQALVHILSESYLESVKAIYKLSTSCRPSAPLTARPRVQGLLRRVQARVPRRRQGGRLDCCDRASAQSRLREAHRRAERGCT